MKTRKTIKIYVGLITIALISQVSFGNATPANKSVSQKFRTQLENVVKSYLNVKDALGKSDAKQAAKGAQQLGKALANVDAKLLNKTNQGKWQKRSDILSKNSKTIEKTADLNVQRKALLTISEQIGEAAKEFGPLSITLYRQFCPMAFDKAGGYWFSDSEEILNPYLGADMPKCGILKETIKAGK